MSSISVIATLLIIGSTFLGCGGGDHSKPIGMKGARHSGLNSKKKMTVETTRVGHYVIKCYSDQMALTGGFDVFRDGKRVYVGEPIPHHLEKIDGLDARDINGDGMPEILIWSFSGGAHCCFTCYVFSLGDRFTRFATFDGENSPIEITDLDHDGRSFSVFVQDATFQYWKTCFADSPLEEVILHYERGRFVMDDRHMRKTPPVIQDFEKEVETVKGSFRGKDVPPILWKYMLDLIYSGNGNLAWKFFDESWPDDVSGKEKFLTEFKEQLGRSPYAADIRRLNGW